MKIAILDAATLGDDIEFGMFDGLGDIAIYQKTAPDEVEERIADRDVVILNKVKLGAGNLPVAGHLKLICVTATGYDNIDFDYCREHGIGVCNVKGYSTDSVAQLTTAMALSLVNHLRVYDDYCKDGSYTASGIHNRLEPVFHELRGMTWGIVGLGAIGKKVAEIAQAFGCRVLAYKRTPDDAYNCVALRELCKSSDIISVHLPLTEATHGIISRDMIGCMKSSAIVINAARGAVVDEAALADAMVSGRLGGLGIDVFSTEPMALDSPYQALLNDPNVIFTPHMAWGAYEARVRCMEEIALNIEAYMRGETRSRVDIL